MKTRTFVALVLTLAACGGPPPELAIEPPPPMHDGAPEATGNEPAPDAPAFPLDGGAAFEGGPDSSEAEAAPARPEPGSEPAPEASSPPMPDAGPTSDGGASTPEAGREAGATVCDGQAPAPPLDCTAATPTCANVRATNERIAAQFPAPCACGALKCAGVTSGTVVETVPVTCRNEAWTVAGMQSGTSWTPWFQCSKGCAAGKICDP
jgi:hypothetical protein